MSLTISSSFVSSLRRAADDRSRAWAIVAWILFPRRMRARVRIAAEVVTSRAGRSEHPTIRGRARRSRRRRTTPGGAARTERRPRPFPLPPTEDLPSEAAAWIRDFLCRVHGGEQTFPQKGRNTAGTYIMF